MSPFDPVGLREEIRELGAKTEAPEFWNVPEIAQHQLKEKKRLEEKLGAYERLEEKLADIELMISLAEEEDDLSLLKEIEDEADSFSIGIEELRIRTLLMGEYDGNNAILSVHGGSGGTDAKDWAEMLYRMYCRWSEGRGYKIKVMDYQDDDEGGINSAVLLVEGENAYGHLKHEKGVHRLVRISPFDSSGRRHTSFASIDVVPEIEVDMGVDIDTEDLRIDTFRSSGAGGQHVNKTDSAIRITHLPTNIVVSCQNERSQHRNKDTAMKLLISKLMELKAKEHKENLKELKGDYSQITWGSQIRSYVFHPYTMVKDHRTGAELGNVQAVMDGNLDYFINEELKKL